MPKLSKAQPTSEIVRHQSDTEQSLKGWHLQTLRRIKTDVIASKLCSATPVLGAMLHMSTCEEVCYWPSLACVWWGRLFSASSARSGVSPGAESWEPCCGFSRLCLSQNTTVWTVLQCFLDVIAAFALRKSSHQTEDFRDAIAVKTAVIVTDCTVFTTQIFLLYMHTYR